MSHVIAALLGVVTGFILPLLVAYVQSRMKGSRFENAARAEIAEAKSRVHEKMLWLSRNQAPYRAHSDERLLVAFDSKLLYLGEPEEFTLALPFWQQNLRDLIEVASTSAFNNLCREVSQLRKFESKFREMKLAFQIGGGDPKQMALACYRDLIQIHNSLIAIT
jgi:hypothetical protein